MRAACIHRKIVGETQLAHVFSCTAGRSHSGPRLRVCCCRAGHALYPIPHLGDKVFQASNPLASLLPPRMRPVVNGTGSLLLRRAVRALHGLATPLTRPAWRLPITAKSVDEA